MRGSLRDFAHFVSMARGSLAEVRTQLILAHRLDYVTASDAAVIGDSAERLAKRLNALRNSLVARMESEQDGSVSAKTQHPKPKTQQGVLS